MPILTHIAQNIGIFEEDVPEPSYPKLLEKVQAYLLDKIHKEYTGLDPVNYTQPLPLVKEIKKKTNASVCQKLACTLTLLDR